MVADGGGGDLARAALLGTTFRAVGIVQDAGAARVATDVEPVSPRREVEHTVQVLAGLVVKASMVAALLVRVARLGDITPPRGSRLAIFAPLVDMKGAVDSTSVTVHVSPVLTANQGPVRAPNVQSERIKIKPPSQAASHALLEGIIPRVPALKRVSNAQ